MDALVGVYYTHGRNNNRGDARRFLLANLGLYTVYSVYVGFYGLRLDYFAKRILLRAMLMWGSYRAPELEAAFDTEHTFPPLVFNGQFTIISRAQP